MAPQTPYQILGVSRHSTTHEIKHAYRALVLKWHPDRHEDDKVAATKRFIEINSAYKELTRTLDLESNFEEPFVMNNNMNDHSSPLERQSSRSSTSSSISSDSSAHRRTPSVESVSQTTPSSSFKESPTRSHWPQSPWVPPSYHPDHKPSSTTYANWRAGSDLPDAFKQTQYRSSHPSHHRNGAAMSKPPPPTLPHSRDPMTFPPPKSIPPRPQYCIIMPQMPVVSLDKQYYNHYGEAATPPAHSAPYDLPFISIGLGQSGEWTYSLPLTLEDIFNGTHINLPIRRRLLSGRSRMVTLELEVPPGCRPGSRILCHRVGHEVTKGILQDIAFILEDKPHQRFTRLPACDDLLLDIQIPWAESLRHYGAEVPYVGIDGQVMTLRVDYPRQRCMKGRNVVKGAGMPVRHGGKVVGRGDLIVEWEILASQAKKTNFVKRFWKK